jgi:peptidyl-prolyl cis-trans isomerase SurA
MHCLRLPSGIGFRYLFVLLSMLAVSSLSACRATPATPAPAVSADTWAMVNGRQITRTDVEKAYQRMVDESQPLSGEEAHTAKLNVLNDLIGQDLLLERARELKIELPESDLQTAYDEAKKSIPDAALQQELSQRNLTIADMREGLRRQLLAEKVIDQEVGSKIDVRDQEVSDFFNANRAQFNFAEEAYHVAQIVITPVREAQVANRTGDDAATPEAATAKVKMLMERLNAGMSFSDLAMDYSEDPESAPRGGDLGLVPVSRLRQAPPQLRDAVLKTAPGTANVVSAGGAHTIVLVAAHELAGQRDLSMPAVRERITETLRARQEQLLRTAYLIAVREDAEVVNYLARQIVESKGKIPSPQSGSPKP